MKANSGSINPKTEFVLVAGKRTAAHSSDFTADPTHGAVSTFFTARVIASYKIPTCIF